MQTMEALELERWIRTDKEQKKSVAEEVARIVDREFRFLDLPEGEGAEPVEIARFMHGPTETTWCLIPGGEFQMGLSADEENAAAELCDPPPFNEEEMRPCHRERVEPFLLMQYPVSVSLVDREISLSPVDHRPRFEGPEGRVPVYLSHEEVSELAEVAGFPLPQEAQWEYACRGGTKTLFFFGDDLPGESELEALVSTRMSRCNPFALYGLFVGEWTSDRFTRGYGGPIVGEDVFAIRGGGSVFWPWQDAGEWAFCVSAMRMPSTDLSEGLCGARLACGIF